LRLYDQFPLGEQLQQQLQGGVKECVMHVIYFPEQEVGKAKEHIFSPVGEVHKQTLERILCDVP
jgi:hypothetical protein